MAEYNITITTSELLSNGITKILDRDYIQTRYYNNSREPTAPPLSRTGIPYTTKLELRVKGEISGLKVGQSIQIVAQALDIESSIFGQEKILIQYGLSDNTKDKLDFDFIIDTNKKNWSLPHLDWFTENSTKGQRIQVFARIVDLRGPGNGLLLEKSKNARVNCYSENVGNVTNLTFNRANNTLTWNFTDNLFALPISGFLLTQSVTDSAGKTIEYKTSLNKTTRSFTFTSLKPGTSKFFVSVIPSSQYGVSASSPAGQSSIPLFDENIFDAETLRIGATILNPQDPSKPYEVYSNVVVPTNKPLFDKSSWANIGTQNGSYGYSLIREALDVAADRWDALIKIHDNVYDYIRTLPNLHNFNGIFLRGFYTSSDIPNDTAAARCGPRNIISLGANKFNTINFDLYYLADPNAYSFSQVVDFMTHELGHALGIGSFWKDRLNTDPNSTFPYALTREDYPETQKAYNFHYKFTDKRGYVPVNFEGLGKGSHFAHITNTKSRFTSFHPAPSYDIMSYGNLVNNQVYISLLSVKNLVDLGYREKQPGVSEVENAGSKFVLYSSILDEASDAEFNPLIRACGGDTDVQILSPVAGAPSQQKILAVNTDVLDTRKGLVNYVQNPIFDIIRDIANIDVCDDCPDFNGDTWFFSEDTTPIDGNVEITGKTSGARWYGNIYKGKCWNTFVAKIGDTDISDTKFLTGEKVSAVVSGLYMYNSTLGLAIAEAPVSHEFTIDRVAFLDDHEAMVVKCTKNSCCGPSVFDLSASGCLFLRYSEQYPQLSYNGGDGDVGFCLSTEAFRDSNNVELSVSTIDDPLSIGRYIDLSFIIWKDATLPSTPTYWEGITNIKAELNQNLLGESFEWDVISVNGTSAASTDEIWWKGMSLKLINVYESDDGVSTVFRMANYEDNVSNSNMPLALQFICDVPLAWNECINKYKIATTSMLPIIKGYHGTIRDPEDPTWNLGHRLSIQATNCCGYSETDFGEFHIYESGFIGTLRFKHSDECFLATNEILSICGKNDNGTFTTPSCSGFVLSNTLPNIDINELAKYNYNLKTELKFARKFCPLATSDYITSPIRLGYEIPSTSGPYQVLFCAGHDGVHPVIENKLYSKQLVAESGAILLYTANNAEEAFDFVCSKLALFHETASTLVDNAKNVFKVYPGVVGPLPQELLQKKYLKNIYPLYCDPEANADKLELFNWLYYSGKNVKNSTYIDLAWMNVCPTGAGISNQLWVIPDCAHPSDDLSMFNVYVDSVEDFPNLDLESLAPPPDYIQIACGSGLPKGGGGITLPEPTECPCFNNISRSDLPWLPWGPEGIQECFSTEPSGSSGVYYPGECAAIIEYLDVSYCIIGKTTGGCLIAKNPDCNEPIPVDPITQIPRLPYSISINSMQNEADVINYSNPCDRPTFILPICYTGIDLGYSPSILTIYEGSQICCGENYLNNLLPVPPSADNNDPNPRFNGKNPDFDNEVSPGIITNPIQPIADDECSPNTNTFDRYHRYTKVVSNFVSNQEIWDSIVVHSNGIGERYDGDANASSSLKIITTPDTIIYHASFSNKSETGQGTFWSYSGGGTTYNISPVRTQSGKYLGNITSPNVSSYVKPENWGTTFMFFWNPSEETVNKLVEMLCSGAVAVSYQISQGDEFPNTMKLDIYFQHLKESAEYNVGDIEYFQGSMPLSNICYGNPGEVSCEDEPGIPENFPININTYGPILNLQESWAVP